MTAAARVLENPFLVLGVAPTASRVEIEREAQKLLGMLELGLEAARWYETPLGRRERTAELVRAAVAALRDPARRLAAEIWASGGDPIGHGHGHDARDPMGIRAPWEGALEKTGWRRRV